MKSHIASLSSAKSFSTAWLTLAAIATMIVLLSFPASAQSVTPGAQYSDAAALRQSFSPAEKKMSFDLVLLSRKAHNAPLGSFASLVNTSEIDANGFVTVDITAFLSPSLMVSPVMADIVRNNGAISLDAYTTDHLHVRLHQTQLIDLAANPNVWAIRSANAGPETSSNHIVAVSASR